jgi:1-acyl-sn-glycerol-3-phosphate acyltransferase
MPSFGTLLFRMRVLCRGSHLVALLVAAWIDGRFFSRPSKGAEGAVWIHGWCKRFVRAFGLRYTVQGPLPRDGAVVSNHMSYLDILIYSAITPFVMVAKREVRDWPLLGWLTAQAGTVYVERREDAVAGRPRQTHQEVNDAMAVAYASGLPVLFFPEGTTTTGDHVLPFRRGLFHSILSGDIPLRTAALHFELGPGNGDATLADDVCFVGDTLLLPHLSRCLGLCDLRATVSFGDLVTTRDDRFVLSAAAHQAVTERREQHLAFGQAEPRPEAAPLKGSLEPA